MRKERTRLLVTYRPRHRGIREFDVRIVREADLLPARVAGHDDARFGRLVAENAVGGIEHGERGRRVAARLHAPERIEHALRREAVALRRGRVLRAPVVVAVAPRIQARRFDAALLPEGLQPVLGDLEPVAPRVRQPELRQPVAAHLPRVRHLPDADVLVLERRVRLDAAVEVLVADDRVGRRAGAARPLPDRPADEVRRPRRVVPLAVRVPLAEGGVVLVEHEAVGVDFLEIVVEMFRERRTERALVAVGVDGEGRMAPVVEIEFRHVAHGVERKLLRRLVRVVRQLGLHHQPKFVAGVEELRRLAARVQAGEVVAGRPHLRHLAPAVVAVADPVGSDDGLDVVVTDAPDVERASVEEELPAAHLELAHAETLAARLQHLAVRRDELDLRRVEVWRFRRPRTKVRKRKFDSLIV